MVLLVGNDFIPNLPHFSVKTLSKVFSNYIDVLPTLGGYINEGGELNLKRFEKFRWNLWPTLMKTISYNCLSENLSSNKDRLNLMTRLMTKLTEPNSISSQKLKIWATTTPTPTRQSSTYMERGRIHFTCSPTTRGQGWIHLKIQPQIGIKTPTPTTLTKKSSLMMVTTTR